MSVTDRRTERRTDRHFRSKYRAEGQWNRTFQEQTLSYSFGMNP